MEETKIKEKIVFEVIVKSRHVFTDAFQWARNILGRNLPAYEVMIKGSIQEALDKLYDNYPDVYDVRITTSTVTLGASEIIVYGKITCQQ